MAINNFLKVGDYIAAGPAGAVIETQKARLEATTRKIAARATEIANLTPNITGVPNIGNIASSIPNLPSIDGIGNLGGAASNALKNLPSIDGIKGSIPGLPDAGAIAAQLDPFGGTGPDVTSISTVSPATAAASVLPSSLTAQSSAGGIQTVPNRPYLPTDPLDNRYDYRTGQKVFTLSNAAAQLGSQRGLGSTGAGVNTPQGNLAACKECGSNTHTTAEHQNAPAFEAVEPRPLDPRERAKRAEWDRQYKLTHAQNGEPFEQFSVSSGPS